MKKFYLNLAVFFGIGKLRPMPGTWGTLAAIPLWFVLAKSGVLVYMAFVALLLPFAIIAAEVYGQETKTHDASSVVIDEVLGFLITMTWLPLTWQAVLAGFLLFRLLDILKPFPIGYLDRKLKGGLGVVVDDVVAGIIANIVLQYVYTQTLWLGVRIG